MNQSETTAVARCPRFLGFLWTRHQWDHGQLGYHHRSCLGCGLHEWWTWAGNYGQSFDRRNCIWGCIDA